jgi:chemotaxis protein CheD
VWTESPRPERFLEPGEVAFAEAPACLRTLLGSCVAITFWHPQRALGAMCHFLVPLRPASEAGPPNGKYASDAIAVITQRFRTRGLAPEAFEVKLFGGGNMFPDLPLNGFQPIGEKNMEAARRLLQAAGFRILREDLAGTGQRMVVFDLQNGEVWVRQGPGLSLTDFEAGPSSLKERTP